MSRLWTDLDNPSLTDDYISPTSDVLLGEFEELQIEPYITRRTNNFSGPPILVAEDVTAFEEVDLLGPPTFILDERSPKYLQTFFVISGLSEKSNRFFPYRVARTDTSPYIVVQDRVELLPGQSRFSPDFFNIKRFTAYVMGRTPAPSLLQEQSSTGIGTTPVVIHPQVVREAEEKSLTDDLETSIKLAQKIYSTLKRIDVNLEHDPEIADRKTIRFTLTVSGKPDLVLKDEFKFKEKLYLALDIKTCEQITTTYKWKS